MSDFYKNFKPLDLDLHGVRLPSFEIERETKRYFKVSEDIDNYDFLRQLCITAFKNLNLKEGTDEYNAYRKRAKYEYNFRKQHIF